MYVLAELDTFSCRSNFCKNMYQQLKMQACKIAIQQPWHSKNVNSLVRDLPMHAYEQAHVAFNSSLIKGCLSSCTTVSYPGSCNMATINGKYKNFVFVHFHISTVLRVLFETLGTFAWILGASYGIQAIKHCYCTWNNGENVDF